MRMLWNQSSHVFIHTCVWDWVQIIFTYTHSKHQSSDNLPPPPSPFCLPFIPRLLLSICGASPSIRPPPQCVHNRPPPERGLMRANDGNARCCFPFINGSTLAHRTQLFIISSLLSAPALLFSPPSITSSLCLLPFTSFITQMECLFSGFLNLYLSSLSFSDHHPLLYEY